MTLYSAAAFFYGLIFGSFFNVVISRLPESKSLNGRSACPKCQNKIAWYDNVPVFSFLALRAKCRKCRAPISWQYPLVELATGFLFYILFERYGLDIRFFSYSIFASMLLILSVIDLHHYIIPDIFSIGGIPLGILNAYLTGDVPISSSLIAVLIGGGLFLFIAWGYEKWTGREGLGGGDIKLLGMIGAWLGMGSLLPVVVMSSLAGTVVGVFLMVFKGADSKVAIPFGPYLAAGAMIYLWYGDEINALLFP